MTEHSIGFDLAAPGGDKTVVIERERDWFFTFGMDHEHANRYVKIHGTFMSTRTRMFELFGSAWAFQYDSFVKFNPQKWGLTELELPA